MRNDENENMGNLNAKKQFVEELMYENIRIMDENIKLIFENKRLRKSLNELESFYKNSLSRKKEDYAVILIGRDKEEYKN